MFGWSSRDLELVLDGDDFTIGGGDDFDGLIFLTVLDRCVTNSGVVFEWEVDPQHAEVGSDNEPNKSNATLDHEEMEIHGQVHHVVSSRLFYLAFDPI